MGHTHVHVHRMYISTPSTDTFGTRGLCALCARNASNTALRTQRSLRASAHGPARARAPWVCDITHAHLQLSPHARRSSRRVAERSHTTDWWRTHTGTHTHAHAHAHTHAQRLRSVSTSPPVGRGRAERAQERRDRVRDQRAATPSLSAHPQETVASLSFFRPCRRLSTAPPAAFRRLYGRLPPRPPPPHHLTSACPPAAQKNCERELSWPFSLTNISKYW